MLLGFFVFRIGKNFQNHVAAYNLQVKLKAKWVHGRKYASLAVLVLPFSH